MKSANQIPLLLVVVTISLTLLAVSSVPVRCSDEPPAEPKQTDGLSLRQRFQLPKIFDFEMYKRVFKRAYHGIEETVRRKYMLARAFRVWISSLKYKYETSSFYLALNQFSDRSPEELERMSNHHLADDMKNARPAKVAPPTIPEVDPIEIEESLSHLAGGDDGVEGLEELRDELRESAESQSTTASRRKREASHQVRDLDIDKLISLPQEEGTLDPETAAKVELKPTSNNPQYEAPEMVSQGVRDDSRKKLDWWEPLRDLKPLARPNSVQRPVSWMMKNMRSIIGGDSENSDEDDNEVFHHTIEQLPDEVFLDHRKSNCMFLPRSQGRCGSCYAFVIIAMAEWLYCKQTGKLVAFSEQYMVDCGKDTKMMNGCSGGTLRDSGHFIYNYGLELRTNYPYWEREDQCPYDEDTDPKSMGYIRMDLRSGFEIPVKHLERYLPSGPIAISINTENGFHEYGGGVLDGAGCQPKGTHAVLLVGHGREHGREYWLVRNSHSVGWGEQGYLKLAKDSNCIQPAYGTLYGTHDGLTMAFKSKSNRQNNPKVVSNHHAKNVLRSLGELDI